MCIPPDKPSVADMMAFLQRLADAITPAPSPGADTGSTGREGSAMGLQEYETRKRVRAGIITGMINHEWRGTGEPVLHSVTILIEGGSTDRHEVAAAWFRKHEPVVGGYLVIYQDGYMSYCPAGVFERDATLVSELPPPTAPGYEFDALISDGEKSTAASDEAPADRGASEDHEARYLRQRALEMALDHARMNGGSSATVIIEQADRFSRYIQGTPEPTPQQTLEEQLYGKRPT